jgi:hypothetical protein
MPFEYPKLTASLLGVLLAVTAALALSSACNADDTTTPTYFIGATDASPPRLGPEDAGPE